MLHFDLHAFLTHIAPDIVSRLILLTFEIILSTDSGGPFQASSVIVLQQGTSASNSSFRGEASDFQLLKSLFFWWNLEERFVVHRLEEIASPANILQLISRASFHSLVKSTISFSTTVIVMHDFNQHTL